MSTPDAGPHGPPPRPLPNHPSLEQLRKQSKDLLRAARREDPDALARLAPFARGPALLAHAQLAVAREYGFSSWPKLVQHLGATADEFVLGPLIRPIELTCGRRWTFDNGTETSTDDVYAMFVAARAGDAASVRRLIERTPELATVEYNYTPPIHFAAREGHLGIVELLLDHGADIGYRSYPFHEALLTLAEDHGHAETASLLRRRLAQRFAIASGVQPLIDAAERGDLKAVQTELARNPNAARAGNETGDTALHHACQQGHLEVVRVLLAAGADADAIRGDGGRPIHCALMPQWFFQVPLGRREKIAELLLAHGVRYTIFIAALRGDREFVAATLTRDPSEANFADTCRQRVLSAAVRRGDLAMTRLLLQHGADPTGSELGAPRGYSLWIAVNDRRRDLVELLLAHGADPNGDIDSCGTPMQQAAKRAPDLLDLLRAHGGKVDEKPPERERAERLVMAGKLVEAEEILRAHPEWIHDDEAGWGDGVMAGPAHDGRHDVLAMLLRLGARVPPVSKWAPYYYFKHEATAAFLLEHGMDPNHMNWHRLTLLHHMAADGELGKARLLLDHGADIDAIDEEYRSTALGLAARWGRTEMVRLLLERGADPEAAGAPWATPLAWARAKGHEDIVRLLGA